jgi:hypothetical protein
MVDEEAEEEDHFRRRGAVRKLTLRKNIRFRTFVILT